MIAEAWDTLNISLFLLSHVHCSRVNFGRWCGWLQDSRTLGFYVSLGKGPPGAETSLLLAGAGEGKKGRSNFFVVVAYFK